MKRFGTTNSWLRLLEEQWEVPFDTSGHDHDHPFHVHPDWPPVNRFEQTVYRILHDSYPAKLRRLTDAYEQIGYPRAEAWRTAVVLLKTFSV